MEIQKICWSIKNCVNLMVQFMVVNSTKVVDDAVFIPPSFQLKGCGTAV